MLVTHKAECKNVVTCAISFHPSNLGIMKIILHVVETIATYFEVEVYGSYEY